MGNASSGLKIGDDGVLLDRVLPEGERGDLPGKSICRSRKERSLRKK